VVLRPNGLLTSLGLTPGSGRASFKGRQTKRIQAILDLVKVGTARLVRRLLAGGLDPMRDARLASQFSQLRNRQPIAVLLSGGGGLLR